MCHSLQVNVQGNGLNALIEQQLVCAQLPFGLNLQPAFCNKNLATSSMDNMEDIQNILFGANARQEAVPEYVANLLRQLRSANEENTNLRRENCVQSLVIHNGFHANPPAEEDVFALSG